MKIGNQSIGINYEPYIIAEMSGNHNGSLLNALKLIDLASKSGADAVKLQTFTPDTITMKSNRKEFFISNKIFPINLRCIWYFN